MNYEKRVVAFIDILGFEDAINSTLDANGLENSDRIEAIENAFIEISTILQPSEGWLRTIKGYKSDPSLKVTRFSDSIVVSLRADDPAEVFASIQSIYWVPVELMRLANLTCRGGVGYGLARHTDQVLFGPAVVQAYRLESKAANYPRIVIHPDVYQILDKSRQRILQLEGLRIEDVLTRDEDGLHYINYFKLLPRVSEQGEWAEYEGTLRQAIEEGISAGDPGILAKYLWMDSKIRYYRKSG